MKIKRVEHVAIAVQNMAESMKMLEDTFGFEMELEETIGTTNLAMYPVGETYIELLETANPDSAVGKWLAEKGYDIKFGARPLSRLIRERLKQPLADEILFGCLKNGGQVTAKTTQGELVLSYTKKTGKRSNSRKT